ncbi:hypothetical protein [Streptomyces camelliae]|uniref:Transposase IS701-like DDE domain-containing protein n=1 Tax=Streptomyces camelliae TaxID=3004093 RepID=A0ABY7NWE7_9ACTN|nr:hypothetical protein [Streptomyces sp. HUAS 2-6]WBO61423.1 hypothetical protein O1G22_00245 [Streptomyces sp. HUAS 2-6]
MLWVGGRGREQLLGHRRLLVRDDVVRPASRDGDGGAQLLADHRADEDGGPLVLQRDAGYLPLPRLQGRRPGRSRCARVGRGLPVRVRCGGRRSPPPARLTAHARRRTLHIDRTWPWAGAFTIAWRRATELPACA